MIYFMISSIKHSHFQIPGIRRKFCSGFDKAGKSSIYGDALTYSDNRRSRDGGPYPRIIHRTKDYL